MPLMSFVWCAWGAPGHNHWHQEECGPAIWPARIRQFKQVTSHSWQPPSVGICYGDFLSQMCVLCLEEPSVDFLLLSCPVVAWAHAHFKQLQHPVQGISQPDCLMWRTICCCFGPAVCWFYLIPAHSCSRRESKHIITCSLSLCHLWICSIRFHPSLLL